MTIMSCVIGIYTRTNIIVQVKNYQLKIDEMRIINVAIKRTFYFNLKVMMLLVSQEWVALLRLCEQAISEFSP